MKQEQTTRLAEMVEWLTAHPRIFDRLCANAEEVGQNAIEETVTELSRQGYYELLLLFIAQNQSHPAVCHASLTYVGRKMAELLRQNDVDILTDEFCDLLFDCLTDKDTPATPLSQLQRFS